MTAPRNISLDPNVYIEVLEEDLTNEIRRARVYRTQVRQLEALLQRYVEKFGDVDQKGQKGDPEVLNEGGPE